MSNIAIDKIHVGRRHRRDVGDVAGLAQSIQAVGLLHPVVISPGRTLIAGQRRLAACKRLGWSEVPVRIVDIENLTRGELDENVHRVDFLPSEIDAIRRTYEASERAAAKERMSAGGKGAKVLQPSRAIDKIGTFAGVSGRTVEKIAAVVEAAEADPERFGKFVRIMDDTGRVDGA